MNEQSGEVLGVSLSSLYEAAYRVADMADVYHGANGSVAATTHGDSGAAFANLSQGASSTAYTGGSVGAAWAELRDELMDIFAETQINLSSTAETLVAVVNHYARDDEAAAESLAATVKEDREDAYHKVHNPDGDKNLPWLPKANTDGDEPVVEDPRMKGEPVKSEDVTWLPRTEPSKSTGTSNSRSCSGRQPRLM